jgi:hypothetical protein
MESFKYSDGVKLRGYVGTNAEKLCVEFCNFVQCHIFLPYFPQNEDEAYEITILCLSVYSS